MATKKENTDMASPSPVKKRREETLRDLLISDVEQLDIQMTSCLYHLSKKDLNQATTILERIRRLLKANHAKYGLHLKEIKLEISALKQKVDGLEKREKYQSKQIATLQSKVDSYKSFLSFDEDFDQDTLDSSVGPQDSQTSSLLGSQDSQNPTPQGSQENPQGSQESQSSSQTPETLSQTTPDQ